MTDSTSDQNLSPKESPQRTTKKETPEFLLTMVVSFILWAIGLVDLLTHTNSNPDSHFIGPYTLVISAFIGAWISLLLFWVGLLLIPYSHHWIQKIIRQIQNRLWLVIGTLAGIGAILWSLFRVKRWEQFPGVGLAIFCFVLMLVLILLLAGWGSYGRGQRWRKLIAVPLVLCLALEGISQGAAYASLLPPLTINSGLYVPNGRIYQSEQGFVNGNTNSNGWYYPEFRQDSDAKTIMLLGDTFVQALQIDPTQNLGVRLQEQLASRESIEETNVIALGMPGFGPGLYLSETRLTNAIERFQPDEIILLFHLSNDFQVVTQPSGYELYYEVKPDGQVDVHEDAWSNRHDLQHLILHGYEEGITPLKTLATNILAPKIIRQLVSGNSAISNAVDPLDMPRVTGEVLSTRRTDETHTDVTHFRVVERPGASNFLFSKEESPQFLESYNVATGILRQANTLLKEDGVTLRIVTIPAFPAAFFDGEADSNWSAELGPYDLLLPERKLAAFAANEGIDFLAMGQTMQNGQIATDQIETFYFNNGQGHFTEAGHLYFAETIFNCLVEKEQAAACSDGQPKAD